MDKFHVAWSCCFLYALRENKISYLVYIWVGQNGVFDLANRRFGPSKARMKNKYRSDYQKEEKLNLRYLSVFKNLLRRILEDSSMNEDFTNAFIANLITKGSRGSLREAKDYVRSLVDQGIFKDETSKEICMLLDRNRKYR
jgi:hypothetical protein